MPTIQRATAQVKEIGMAFTSLFSDLFIFPSVFAFPDCLSEFRKEMLALREVRV